MDLGAAPATARLMVDGWLTGRHRIARGPGRDSAADDYASGCRSSNMYGIISYTVGWMCMARRITV